jgi:hypothetical protein
MVKKNTYSIYESMANKDQSFKNVIAGLGLFTIDFFCSL